MQRSSEEAVESAYRSYFAVISYKCARMLGDSQEARDVAQETFARLWERRLTLRDPLAITAWVYRTSTRLAIERIRRRARAAEDANEPAESALAAADDPEARAHTRRLLLRLSRELSAQEIEVAVLSHVDELTQTEIADVLECSERTVRRVLVRVEERTRKLAEGMRK
jgi:RNA polymerase sigma-70 factor (ECF subfamily)